MSMRAGALEPASEAVAFPGGTPDGSKERPYRLKDSQALSVVLTAPSVGVRFNLRNRRTEWVELGREDHDGRASMSERRLAIMREEIARNLYVDARGGLKPLVWTRDAFSGFS